MKWDRDNIVIYETDPKNYAPPGESFPTKMFGYSVPILIALRRALGFPFKGRTEDEPLFVQPSTHYRAVNIDTVFPETHGGATVVEYCLSGPDAGARAGARERRATWNLENSLLPVVYATCLNPQTPIGIHALQNVIKTAAQEAGFKGKFTNHGTLSRLIATHLIESSAGVLDYSRAGGWRSAEAVQKNYAHTFAIAAMRLQSTMRGKRGDALDAMAGGAAPAAVARAAVATKSPRDLGTCGGHVPASGDQLASGANHSPPVPPPVAQPVAQLAEAAGTASKLCGFAFTGANLQGATINITVQAPPPPRALLDRVPRFEIPPLVYRNWRGGDTPRPAARPFFLSQP